MPIIAKKKGPAKGGPFFRLRAAQLEDIKRPQTKMSFPFVDNAPYSLPTTNICFHCNFTFLYDLGLAFGIDSGHPLLSCCHTHFCCHPFGAGSDAFVELSPGPPQPVQTGRVPFVAAVLNSPKTVCIR